MSWRDDPKQVLRARLVQDDLSDSGYHHTYERRFWIELWQVPPPESVDENGVQLRHYGPIRVFALPDSPRQPLFNIALGADRPGAVADGHLAAALEWTESLGLDCRVPLREESALGEPAAAEDLLNRRAYRRTAKLAILTRPAGPAEFPAPPGIEIRELDDEYDSETFANLIAHAYGMPLSGHEFLYGLPIRPGWRSYLALDEDEVPIAAATTTIDSNVPQLAFFGTHPDCRGRGANTALLHRTIEDANEEAKYRELFAVTEEPLECPEAFSAGARNLLRAGFELSGLRTVWRPPKDKVTPAPEDEQPWGWGDDEEGDDDGDWDEEDDGDEDEDDDEDWDDDDPDEDHEFRLED